MHVSTRAAAYEFHRKLQVRRADSAFRPGWRKLYDRILPVAPAAPAAPEAQDEYQRPDDLGPCGASAPRSTAGAVQGEASRPGLALLHGALQPDRPQLRPRRPRRAGGGDPGAARTAGAVRSGD